MPTPLRLACLPLLLALAACEEPPLPAPPADLGKMEPLAPSPEKAQAAAEKEALDEGEVVEGAIRLSWKLPPGEKVLGFRIATRPGPGKQKALDIDLRKAPGLKRVDRRVLKMLCPMQLPAHFTLTGVMEPMGEYGTYSVRYVLGKIKRGHLPRHKLMAKLLRQLQGKVVLTAEIAKSGAVLDVSSGFADRNILTYLFEMPGKPVREGETWKLDLSHFSSILFERKKLDEKAEAELVKIETTEQGSLATIRHRAHSRMQGEFAKLATKPVRQSLSYEFRGQGVFDVGRGCWKSYSGRYKARAKGLFSYRQDLRLRFEPLKQVSPELLAASRAKP
ncbi:MAG: hypothetical protein JXR96_06760 [Deltaproteobacteria bacterium]|nr:hypothetical protein [Deltaproteobacteria bacterium]